MRSDFAHRPKRLSWARLSALGKSLIKVTSRSFGVGRMLFSWNQLTDYLRLTIPHEELADRLSLVGFNHESTRDVGGDLCVDLEITSNRPDCLNHLGIAREIGLLLDQPVCFPEPKEPKLNSQGESSIKIENQAPDLCGRFEAITIHGTTVGKSPTWLVRRLETLGVRSINNIVDITNYVMNESGQPIHAYDLDKLEGRTLIVRRAGKKESAEALNHQRYVLDESMLVISDRTNVVSLAGVMGCSNSEISTTTANVVIETARFDPMNIRRTSRALGLQSPSSYRFERPIDPSMLIWARNRCVELILQTGGGTIGTATSDSTSLLPTSARHVTLRVGQVARLLGIEVDRDEIKRILVSLGLELVGEDQNNFTFQAPSWRSDLDRGVDLIEEVGRIHNYDQIPEDRPVTLGAIQDDRRGRVEGNTRSMLTGLGFSEAITYSFVSKELVGEEFAPDPNVEPIRVDHATRKQSNLMRLSLIPSLLEASSYNEAHGNFGVRLFEIANVYQPIEGQDLPRETSRLALLSPGDYFAIKGILESLMTRLHASAPLRWESKRYKTLRPGHSAEIFLGSTTSGFAGEVAASVQARLKLRGVYSALEISMDDLESVATMTPQHEITPIFPGVQRDLSLVVAIRMTWAMIEATVRESVDSTFEAMTFEDSFRGGNLDKDQQSIHFSLRFRNPEKTMTSDEIDAKLATIIDHCRDRLGATVRT